jgi:hypothetical protein
MLGSCGQTALAVVSAAQQVIKSPEVFSPVTKAVMRYAMLSAQNAVIYHYDVAARFAALAAADIWVWGDYFAVLDAALNAGPQGEPWSADAVAHGARAYALAGGV